MKNKGKNIALVGINPYDGNRGVGALAYSILYLLDTIAKKQDLKFNIFILINGFRLKKKDKFEILDFSLDAEILHQLDIFSIKKLIKSIIFIREIKSYMKFDYIMDMSYGDGFSDLYGEKNFEHMNSPKRFFHFLKKRQLLLPQTIGPFLDANIKKRACASIENMDVVLARDLSSYEFVKSETNQKKVHESIDVAFFMPYKQKKFDPRDIHVGIGVSALLWKGGFTRNNQFKLVLDYREMIMRLINHFLGEEKAIVHLVPHVVGEKPSLGNDYELSQRIADQFDNERLVLAPFFLSPIHAKNYISGLDFFMGSRMHACIAAFSSGVPVFPMAYSRKFSGLFQRTLEYGFMGDMTRQRPDEFFGEVVAAFGRRDELRSIIAERRDRIVEARRKSLMRLMEEFLELST